MRSWAADSFSSTLEADAESFVSKSFRYLAISAVDITWCEVVNGGTLGSSGIWWYLSSPSVRSWYPPGCWSLTTSREMWEQRRINIVWDTGFEECSTRRQAHHVNRDYYASAMCISDCHVGPPSRPILQCSNLTWSKGIWSTSSLESLYVIHRLLSAPAGSSPLT